MAFPTASGVPRPSLPTSQALSADRAEWLVLVVYGVLLAVILALNGPLAGGMRSAASDTAVCQRHALIAPGLFVVPLH